MKVRLLLTFDHELPLGNLKSSYDAALFEPTRKVLRLADILGVKVTLFTDILCGLRFKEWDYHNFYLPYTEQLQAAVADAHDVQLHIHPHWLTSRFENGAFVPSADFALSDFDEEIADIITLAIDGLTKICTQTKAGYTCKAFRAGGYNVGLSTTKIFDTLYRSGVRFDSSMARGYYFKSPVSEVDYTHLPKKSNWVIDPENLSRISSGDGITEIPIATIPKTPFEVPTAFKMKKYEFRAPFPHGGVIHQAGGVDFLSRLKMKFSYRMLTFDNYTLSSDYLMKIFRYNINKYNDDEDIMLSLISHPKSMSSYSLELMREFIEKVRKEFPFVEFTTFDQL